MAFPRFVEDFSVIQNLIHTRLAKVTLNLILTYLQLLATSQEQRKSLKNTTKNKEDWE
jgi:hypothetical protein